CESIYSMEGDHAPLKEISNLAKKHKAHLIVDESHSTGLFGDNGSGLVNQLDIRNQVLCTIHTAGKALGVSGAWIAGSSLLKEYLINFSRGLMFSTAPSPIQFIMIEEALLHLESSLERSVKVLSRAEYLRNELKCQLADTKAFVLGQNSPIIPIVLNDNDAVLNVFNDSVRKQHRLIA
ncbi:MAG: pyridoxal phosphate-dependent aminotransferase family protein, partial [Ignavibacteriae bacterium]|nr:pyridoxal phosphate-dependent aminotransferase family protein [Ignavibacteriota bacterium]